MLKKIVNPDLFHGNRKDNFFEGWYYKLVHPTLNLTYCFIVGIFISPEIGSSHSFIQVLKGHETSFKYIRYAREKFFASETEYEIKVDKNSFSLSNISLAIDQEGEKIYGNLDFKNVYKWPDSFINPGSMGFYNYFSFMQCYSQVCAIDGNIKGSLSINGKDIDFTGGKVYIEKNWGRAFPYSYIWIQGNNFVNKEISLTCSIGHIPFLFSSFTGFLVGLKSESDFYKFTTINRSSLKIRFNNNRLILEISNRKHLLVIDAYYKEDTFMTLLAPRENGMIPIAKETLQGSIKVRLLTKSKHNLIFEDFSDRAGIEFSGDFEKLF